MIADLAGTRSASEADIQVLFIESEEDEKGTQKYEVLHFSFVKDWQKEEMVAGTPR